MKLCKDTDMFWYMRGEDKEKAYQQLAADMTAWSSKSGDHARFQHSDVIQEIQRNTREYKRVGKELSKEGIRLSDPLTLGDFPDPSGSSKDIRN